MALDPKALEMAMQGLRGKYKKKRLGMVEESGPAAAKVMGHDDAMADQAMGQAEQAGREISEGIGPALRELLGTAMAREDEDDTY